MEVPKTSIITVLNLVAIQLYPVFGVVDRCVTVFKVHDQTQYITGKS